MSTWSTLFETVPRKYIIMHTEWLRLEIELQDDGTKSSRLSPIRAFLQESARSRSIELTTVCPDRLVSLTGEP